MIDTDARIGQLSKDANETCICRREVGIEDMFVIHRGQKDDTA